MIAHWIIRETVKNPPSRVGPVEQRGEKREKSRPRDCVSGATLAFRMLAPDRERRFDGIFDYRLAVGLSKRRGQGAGKAHETGKKRPYTRLFMLFLKE